MSSPMSKPGIKTTEFWLTILVIVGSGLGSIFGDAEWVKVVSLFVGALSAMGYAQSRGRAKSGSAAIVTTNNTTS